MKSKVVPNPAIPLIFGLFILWGFGYETVGSRLKTQLEGVVVSSRDIPSTGAPRYATEYTLRGPDGRESLYVAGATDASLPRSMPVGTSLKKILTPSMKKLGIKEPGKAAHAFRRFRSSILAKSGVEEDIRKFWLGHEYNDITAQYAEQIREDNVWRQTLAANVGLGFQIPAFVPKPIVRNVRKNRQAVEVAMVG
jgi:hypothetical protein